MNIKAQTYDFLEKPAGLLRGNATAHVVGVLRRAIVTLELPPGSPIDKALICERLGVSRFPVSEALSRLQFEGLVEIMPQRGSMVSRLRIADVREFMLIRKALEAEAVHALAKTVSTAVITQLRTLVTAQEKAIKDRDHDRFHDLDLEFHELLFSGMRFGRIKTIIDNARANVDRARRLLNTPQRVALTIAEHTAIVDALERRDSHAAADAMRGHIEAVMFDLIRFATDQPELFTDGEAELAKNAEAERANNAVANSASTVDTTAFEHKSTT